MANNLAAPAQVFRVDGKNCFAEIMCNALKIGKIAINFVSYDAAKTKGSRETGSVTIYMNIFEARVFAGDILSGLLARKGIEKKKEAEAQAAAQHRTVYPGRVYELLGGSSGANTADHQPISRQFALSPGASKPWVLEACSGPGKIIGKGLIAPEGRPTTIVRVGMDDKTLKQFAYALITCCELWQNAKFMPIIAPEMEKARQESMEAINKKVNKDNLPAEPPKVIEEDFVDELPY
jgi:hypothetical protein